jgi:Macrocin-O-methyltransferase (TylF)
MPGVAESYTIASVGAPEDYREPPRPIAALPPRPGTEELRAAYLSLLKLSLCDLTSVTTREVRWTGDRRPFTRELTDEDQLSGRALGKDWALDGMTMIGLRRLDDLQACVESVVEDGIEGDLIEAGVWRGGASILVRATLDSLGATDRTLWLADSFEDTLAGLRPSTPGFPPAGSPWTSFGPRTAFRRRSSRSTGTGDAGGARTLLSIPPTVPSQPRSRTLDHLPTRPVRPGRFRVSPLTVSYSSAIGSPPQRRGRSPLKLSWARCAVTLWPERGPGCARAVACARADPAVSGSRRFRRTPSSRRRLRRSRSARRRRPARTCWPDRPRDPSRRTASRSRA